MEYTNYELYQILEENGYKTTEKNLQILKEGLESGKYEITVSDKEVLSEDFDGTDEERSLLESYLNGTLNEKALDEGIVTKLGNLKRRFVNHVRNHFIERKMKENKKIMASPGLNSTQKASEIEKNTKKKETEIKHNNLMTANEIGERNTRDKLNKKMKNTKKTTPDPEEKERFEVNGGTQTTVGHGKYKRTSKTAGIKYYDKGREGEKINSTPIAESFSDYELYQILEDNGYKTTNANLDMLKEGLVNGKYDIDDID